MAETALGVGDAFGPPRAARREEDHGWIIRPGPVGRRSGGSAFRQRLERPEPGQFTVDRKAAEFQISNAGALRNVVRALGMGDHQPRFAQTDGVVDILRQIAVVQWDGHKACAEAGQVVHKDLQAVWQERDDPVAAPKAEIQVTAGEVLALCIKPAPRQAVVHRGNRNGIGLLPQTPTREGVIDRPNDQGLGR